MAKNKANASSLTAGDILKIIQKYYFWMVLPILVLVAFILKNMALGKIKSDFEQVMNDELKGLGATDAFNPDKADFTGIANSVNGRIFISQVIHKTHIEVDRKGTKAAAATVIITKHNGAVTGRFETVICDRPFVYAIVNVKTMNPVFIGTVNNV